MLGVSLCSKARPFSAASSASVSLMSRSAARGKLHREAGVEQIGRRHAEVQETRLRAYLLGEISEEGNDIVLRHFFDGIDTRDIEVQPVALLPDRLSAAAFGTTPISAKASQA